MNDEQWRRLYWDAVSNLNEIISEGKESKEEIIKELENDLE